jgi:hypothetical protein
MNGIISGICLAIVIAVGAAFYLDHSVQQSAETAFTTSGVRL